MGTAANLTLLLKELKGCRRREGRCCVLVDFKSAYNTVSRERLYSASVPRGIFAPEEVQFLRCLHSDLYFVDGRGERVYLHHGVHQGSPMSPALLNIYKEVFLSDLSRAVPGGSFSELPMVLQQLRCTAGDYGLVYNEQKSGVFTVKRHHKLGE